MITKMLARRYAKALLEAANNAGEEKNITGQFREFVELAGSNSDMERILSSPVVTPISRKKIIEKISEKSGYHNIFTNFLSLLNEKGRIKYFSEIYNAYLEMLDESQGILKARLLFAENLSGEEAEKIRKVLEKISGKRVKLDMNEDSSLIGGIRVEMAGTIYDGSLKNRIKMLKDQLTGE
jgi:F-type H+-transporting ATPase subunit delta